MKHLISISLLAFFSSLSTYAQNDSLFGVWNDESKSDSIRARAIASVFKTYLYSDPDSAILIAGEQLKFCRSKGLRMQEAEAELFLGAAHWMKGNLEEATFHFELSGEVFEELKHKHGLSNVYNNLAVILHERGEFYESKEYNEKALEIRIALNDSDGISASYNNLGVVYLDIGKYVEAYEYYIKSLNIRKALGDMIGVSSSYNNLANFFRDNGKLEEAAKYYERSMAIDDSLGHRSYLAKTQSSLSKVYLELGRVGEAQKLSEQSLKITREVDNPMDLAQSLSALGAIHQQKSEYEAALEAYEEALSLRTTSGRESGSSHILFKIASVYYEMGEIRTAKEKALKALQIGKEIPSTPRIKESAELLSRIYEKEKDGLNALEMYKLYVQMRDSIQSSGVRERLAKAESKAEFEKQQIIEEQREMEEARQKELEERREHNIQYSGIGIGLFLLFALVFALGSIRIPKWLGELLVFLPFLILFGFLLVVTDPYVDALTGNTPLYKLLINATMAGLIFPIHGFFEGLMKKRVLRGR